MIRKIFISISAILKKMSPLKKNIVLNFFINKVVLNRLLIWCSMLLIVILFSSCDQNRNNSFELDKTVGIQSIDTAKVTVSGGLAIIKEFKSGLLNIHTSAPELSITLEVLNAESLIWKIEIGNIPIGVSIVASEHYTIHNEISEHGIYTLDVEFPSSGEYTIDFRNTLTDSSFSFAVMSDVQAAITSVEDIYNTISADKEILFLVSTGDLTSNGKKSEFKKFINKLDFLSIPFYSTLGNHDTFDSNENYWRKIFGRGTFSFEYRGSRFIFIDSARGTIDNKNYSLLKRTLQSHVIGLNFFITHYPIVDPFGLRGGALSSRNEAYKLLGILIQGGVDVLFFGHIHSYYHFSIGGVDTYISGGGGAIPEKFDNVGRHYLKVTVNPEQRSYTITRVSID